MQPCKQYDLKYKTYLMKLKKTHLFIFDFLFIVTDRGGVSSSSVPLITPRDYGIQDDFFNMQYVFFFFLETINFFKLFYSTICMY